MGCFITKTPSKVCADKVKKSGVKRAWLANASEIDSITMDLAFGNTVVTAITLETAAAKFHELDPKLFSASYKESTKLVNGIPETTQTFEFFLHAQAQELTDSSGLVDPTTEVLVFLSQLAESDGVVVVWEDYAGTNGAPGNMYVAGLWKEETNDFTKFALKLATDEYDSGKVLTDPNGDTVTLQATLPAKRLVFNGTLDESESV